MVGLVHPKYTKVQRLYQVPIIIKFESVFIITAVGFAVSNNDSLFDYLNFSLLFFKDK